MRGGQVLDAGSKGTLVKMISSAPESCRKCDWGIVRKAGKSFHRLVARSDLASQVYFWVMPHISRRLWPAVQQRLRNSINSVAWPNMALRPRSVTLGNHTDVLLCPHLQEFDMEAALSTAIGLRARSLCIPRVY